MTFAEDIWLFLTPVIVILVAALALYGLRQRSSLLGKFAAARLLDNLTEHASRSRILVKVILVLLTFGAIGLALARPQWGVEWTEQKSRGLDLVFVLDASKSMLATDQRPNRLERAKLSIRDLLERLQGDRVGLVVFAGRAFLQTPPTLDYAAFRESLEAVDPRIMSRGGSDLGNAIREAARAFPSEGNVKVVVLLTDGEDLGGDALVAAQEAAENNIQIHSIGLGTPEGEYLRIENKSGEESFIRDATGQPVRSQLDESTLREISESTGGMYARLAPTSLNQLYNEVLSALPRQERESKLKEMRVERFQWALGAAILFLVVEILIRRRSQKAAVALIGIILIGSASPTPTYGQDVDEVSIESPAILSAEALYNKGQAALVSGQYESSLNDFGTAVQETEDRQIQRAALYNMGHATFQLGETAFQNQEFKTAIEQWQQAEELFQSAQEIDPEDGAASEDAETVRARREALEKFLEQQQEKQQEEQDSENSDQENEEDSSDSEQESEQQEGDQEQSEDESSEEKESSEENQEEGSDQQEGDSQSEQEENSESENESQQSDSGQESESEEENQQQSQEGDESESAEEEQNSQPVPEVGEDDSGASESTTEDGTPETQQVIGMSERDAERLLDSLRNKEQLLPFVDQTEPAKGGKIQDW